MNLDTCRDSSITHYPFLKVRFIFLNVFLMYSPIFKYFPRNSVDNNFNLNVTVGHILRSYQSLAQMRDRKFSYFNFSQANICLDLSLFNKL